MQKKKICYLITGLNSGGAQMMLLRLLERINRLEFEPLVISLLESKGPIRRRIENCGVTVRVVGMRGKTDIPAIWKVFQLIREARPDVLHTQLFAADLIGRTIGWLLKVPAIVTGIRNEYYGSEFRYKLLKITESCSHITVFVSRAAASRFIERTVLPAEKAKVIYNGIDPEQFYEQLSGFEREKVKREFGFDKSTFLVAAVGSLTLQKGYPLIFESFRKAFIDEHIVQLAVAGDGPMRLDLEGLATNLNLAGKIKFLGRIDDIPRLLSCSDLLVLGSLWEGLPGVVLEAMGASLPVVSSSVGGVPEIVVEGKTGFLVKPGSVEHMSAAMRTVFQMTQAEREAIGQAGRLRIKKHFHIDRMVQEYEELYKALLT